MQQKRKHITLLVAMLFIAAILLSVFFMATKACHDCAGEDCGICTGIAAASSLMHLAATLFAVAWLSLVILTTIKASLSSGLSADASRTLVWLKVKLSN